MSREAEFVLKRIEDEVAKLNGRRYEISFDLETWKTWSEVLEKTSLSQDQARRLLFSLAAFCTPSTETPSFTNPGQTAIFQSLHEISEAREYVSQWTLPSHPEVVEFNKRLDLGSYLPSKELGEDLKESLEWDTDASIGGFHMRPILLVVYYLVASSPAYAVVENLKKMGLAESNEEQLQLFFEKRNKATAIFVKTDVVFDALENIEANRLLQIQFLKVVDQVKRKDYREYVKLADELRYFQTQVYQKQLGMLGVRKENAHSEAETRSLTHQLATLAIIEKIKDTMFNCLTFFARRNSPRVSNWSTRSCPSTAEWPRCVTPMWL